MALDPLNSSNLEQLALKGLIFIYTLAITVYNGREFATHADTLCAAR